MSSEKISIVIPYYNGEHYILETLESIDNQTYRDFEVIIVNDGSDPKKLEEIVTKLYPEVKILHQENNGQSSARNNGASYANGKYLLFLDCDDKIDPTYLEKTLTVLQNNKTIRICYTKGMYFEARADEWLLPDFKIRDFLIENSIPITALIYREDFEKIGGFDQSISFYEDWELWISMIQNGAEVSRINEFLFFYRSQNKQNSLTNNTEKNHKKLGDNTFYIYKKHYNLYAQHDLDFFTLFTLVRENKKYKKKYYNTWYRKMIYKIFKSKKYQKIYPNL